MRWRDSGAAAEPKRASIEQRRRGEDDGADERSRFAAASREAVSAEAASASTAATASR